MLRLILAITWAVARGVELLLLSWLLFVIFGPTAVPGWEGALGNIARNVYSVGFFFVASGYLISTAWFEILRRSDSLLVQMWIGIAVFSLHSTVFLLNVDIDSILPVLVFGICVVTLSSLVGHTLIRALSHSVQ